jgi:hypothetical protein
MAACDLICSTISHERQANASIEQRIKNNSPLLLLLDCINLLPLPRLLTLQSLHFHLQLSPPRHGTLQLFCLLLFAPTKLLFERCIHSRLPTLLQGHFLHHDGLLYLCCSRSSLQTSRLFFRFLSALSLSSAILARAMASADFFCANASASTALCVTVLFQSELLQFSAL